MPMLTRRRMIAALAAAGLPHVALARPFTDWPAFRAGTTLALMRHAQAPGIGDPAGMTLGDCSTQRNLDDAGREQARQIGAMLRANGIDRARVMSSAWCRCLETAELLGFGAPEPLAPLNSFFEQRGAAGQQSAELLGWIAGQPVDGPLILVTHQVNITALSGRGAASGQIILMRRGPGIALSYAGEIDPLV